MESVFSSQKDFDAEIGWLPLSFAKIYDLSDFLFVSSSL